MVCYELTGEGGDSANMDLCCGGSAKEYIEALVPIKYHSLLLYATHIGHTTTIISDFFCSLRPGQVLNLILVLFHNCAVCRSV